MNRILAFTLTLLCSFSALSADKPEEYIDRLSSRHNPTNMKYYMDHYQNTDSPEYQNILISVRTAADAINFYTERLDKRNQRIDYCLPMDTPSTRKTLRGWKTEEFITLINEYIRNDSAFKKYGKYGIGGSVSSYLIAVLKDQYPCPIQKQL